MIHNGTDTVRERTDSNDGNGQEPALHSSSVMGLGAHSHRIESGGDAETRPVNVAVHWLIKVR